MDSDRVYQSALWRHGMNATLAGMGLGLASIGLAYFDGARPAQLAFIILCAVVSVGGCLALLVAFTRGLAPPNPQQTATPAAPAKPTGAAAEQPDDSARVRAARHSQSTKRLIGLAVAVGLLVYQHMWLPLILGGATVLGLFGVAHQRRRRDARRSD